MEAANKQIAILGGGPSGLFMYKRIIESKLKNVEVSIFERKKQLGEGMPYSVEGANIEHVTNVSDNEIPQLVTHISEWIKDAPTALLEKYNISPANFNEYKVLPRLFFGAYLSDQFNLLKAKADEIELITNVYLESTIIDINDLKDKVIVKLESGEQYAFDHIIICTGHNWPKKYEGKFSGYFDSPYPPAKIALQLNSHVAIRGSSLTAIDAIRTLSRKNGSFIKGNDGFLKYQLNSESEGFKMIMHSRNGLLPAVRFHLADSHLSNNAMLSIAEIQQHRVENNGFISLDYIFEKDFKEIFKTKDPDFYETIKDMDIEKFVESMMELRDKLAPFQLLRAEYIEAEKSIKRKESVYWKEMLAILSFSMNYPAKYLSAEDMLRLKKVLMPLISIVIAFVPQSSCLELLALHSAGVLDIVAVGDDSKVEPLDKGGITYRYTDELGKDHSVYYPTFIDCIGQPHLNFRDFPFRGLITGKSISPALLKFNSLTAAKEVEVNQKDIIEINSSGDYFLKVPGIAINDNFNVVDDFGAFNERIFVMAVPYIGGFNPDYSGLDFSEEASKRIIDYIILLNSHALQE